MKFKQKVAAVLLSASIMLGAGAIAAPAAQAATYLSGADIADKNACGVWVATERVRLITKGYTPKKSGCQYMGVGVWHGWVMYSK